MDHDSEGIDSRLLRAGRNGINSVFLYVHMNFFTVALSPTAHFSLKHRPRYILHPWLLSPSCFSQSSPPNLVQSHTAYLLATNFRPHDYTNSSLPVLFLSLSSPHVPSITLTCSGFFFSQCFTPSFKTLSIDLVGKAKYSIGIERLSLWQRTNSDFDNCPVGLETWLSPSSIRGSTY